MNAREAFASRLVQAMLENGYRSARNAKSGVDVGPLGKVAKVTREMARRYTEGTALPDPDKMQAIASWLGVRMAWLRDGEGSVRDEAAVRQPRAEYVSSEALSPEAREIALAWSRLSPHAKEMMRNLIFITALAERRYPWMLRGRPVSETYDQWEHRQEQNFQAMSQLERDRKAKTK